MGSIGIDLNFQSDWDYDWELGFLQVVMLIIAQAINISHLVEVDRDQLRDENEPLREERWHGYDFYNIIGHHSRLPQVYEQIM